MGRCIWRDNFRRRMHVFADREPVEQAIRFAQIVGVNVPASGPTVDREVLLLAVSISAFAVTNNETIATGLSVPHAPQVDRDKLWLVDSGTGFFGTVDRATGKYEPITFCPGYLRGLSFIGDYAVIGSLLQRMMVLVLNFVESYAARAVSCFAPRGFTPRPTIKPSRTATVRSRPASCSHWTRVVSRQG